MRELNRPASNKLAVVLAVILLASNFAWYAFSLKKAGTESNKAKQYPLLSKRIFADNPNDILVNFVPLRQAIKTYLLRTKTEHSLFFEYLPTGTSIRSNENTQLAGASLLKLPTIISLYKAEEMGKVNLNREVVIEKEWLDDRFGDLWKKGAGTKITLAEAARLALVDSDDTAIKTIRGVLGDTIPNNETILSQLDIEFPFTPENEQSQVSARDYSAILRCLYLSCYLSTDRSQAILSQLSQANDFNRIAKGVPDNVRVAHKIGVFGNEVQSDCGIVYVPNRPYIVCIILKAPSNIADPQMQVISKLIYDYVSDLSR